MSVQYHPVRKRSVVVGNLKTALSLEEPFWLAFKEIAKRREMSQSALLAELDIERHECATYNLSSAVRQLVLADTACRLAVYAP
jgi:predicted DNA-binding ribbon-helix-helix protein